MYHCHNLNDYVRFKLTDFGRDVLKHRLDVVTFKPDTDGFSKASFHEFCHIFGLYLYLGSPTMPVETEIFFKN